MAAKQEEVKMQSFARALFSRSNPLTYLFIGINLGVFFLMWLAGGMGAMATDHNVLIGFGAKVNSLINQNHEYWRLVTCIFIHIGFLHIFFNNYALWIVGQEIERLYGSSRFALLYLVTGIAGSLGSYIFNPQATSAGASGAIFGLFGVMATFAFRYRTEIPDILRREITRRVLPLIVINLLFGFSIAGIDNSAHLGGLFSGVVLGLVIPYKRPNEKATAVVWRALMVICMAIIAGSWILAFRNYDGPRPQLANLTATPNSNEGIVEYFEGMQKGFALLKNSFDSTGASHKDQTHNSAQAALKLIEEGIKSTNTAPNLKGEAEQYRQKLLALLTRHKEILQKLSTTNQADLERLVSEETELQTRSNQLDADYQNWLPGFLQEHGYEIRKEPGEEQPKGPTT